MEFDFGQNQTVESLDRVPEDFRGLYRQVEGEDGYKLGHEDPAVAAAIAAIPRLNSALKAARADVKNAKGQTVDLSALSDYGSDPESIATGIQAKIDELTSQIKGGDEAKAETEKVKEALGKKHATATKALETRIQALTTQLYTMLVDNEALKEIGDQAQNPKLLLPFIRERCRPNEEEGAFGVDVIDDNGPRFSQVTGNKMTVAELVKEMKASEEFGVLFKSEAVSGTGKPPGSSSKLVKAGPTTKTSLDKIASGLKARTR
jgi:hypothetical protein